MEAIKTFFTDYVRWLSFPDINILDVVEMLILAFAMYHIILWVKNTRAWMLVKGILVLIIAMIIAVALEMNVILWILRNTIGVGITAVVIVFQPELRSALEQLGRQNVLRSFIPFDEQKDKNERYSEKSINEIVRAVFDLAKTKTGALIVMEREIVLKEYERTGIVIDSAISNQLLINIFEHNTPLHDGAVIVRNNRIVAATCYLPLSDNMELSKELGTRHRAAVGISEVSDSITIIVSEETGMVSIACDGVIMRNLDQQILKERLMELQQHRSVNKKTVILKRWKRSKRDA